jgi:hypothetical protein
VRGGWTLIEETHGEPGLHEYGIPHTAWLRGVRFMRHFGVERALDLIDQRAEWAAERGDYDTARRWRDLITAIQS